MDAAMMPQAADQSRAGLTGARGVVKHTILSNPREVAIMLAVLVVVVIVLVYMLYKCWYPSKEGHAGPYRSQGVSMISNHQTGSNSPKAFSGGLGDSGLSASSGLIKWPAGALPGMAGSTGTDKYESTYGVIPAEASPLMDDDPNSLDMSQLGSACAGRDAAAVKEFHVFKHLNGGSNVQI